MTDNEPQQFEPSLAVGSPLPEIYSIPAERPKPKILLPAVLFAVTVFTTLLAGIFMELGFLSQSGQYVPRLRFSLLLRPETWLLGVPFSVTLLGILMAHEMGHFLMCRHYRIDATYPFVLPAPPLLNPFGTFGAVIRIRSPFGDSRQLFDVGIAGPLAGFVVLIPALVVGLSLSTIYHGRLTAEAYEFGEPLLFKWLSQLFFSGQLTQINLHPIGFAAWFGMLATSLNLLPIGQLDGGHVVFALAGPRGHCAISIGTVVLLILVSLASLPMPGYLPFGVVLFFIGLKHPPPLQDNVPLGTERVVLALVALGILVLTFIVVPVRIM